MAVKVRGMGGETVKGGKPFHPELEYQGSWYPVCENYFNTNDFGATIVCKTLGFTAGTFKKKQSNPAHRASGYTFNVNAMPVGKCDNADQDLDQCKFRNVQRFGEIDCDSCNCKAGKGVGLKVICTGALSPGSCGAFIEPIHCKTL